MISSNQLSSKFFVGLLSMKFILHIYRGLYINVLIYLKNSKLLFTLEYKNRLFKKLTDF